MGQGLAPAEPATSAAASCLRRRRRRAIGAIVVCGPFLGCPFDECGAHRVADLPAQRFRHERGAKIWIWRPQADRSKIPKDFWEPIWQTLSRIARGRLGMRRVAAFSRQVSLLGNRNAFAATLLTIRTVPELGSTRAQLEPLHHTACSSKGFSISRAPGGTRDVTRRRSEPSHSSAHRCKQ